ncbi:hypothetical protein OH76DRAFT_1253737 [Lentinus brumalis]|uniref:Uncharacterized protein n=1 Tax=Lentinus brumalis TaxID=2498619 RepID=A0A371CRH4_9APHY|nr:hypothetical protein OH76DRAFT_1253737 [Polyporus brumalis]
MLTLLAQRPSDSLPGHPARDSPRPPGRTESNSEPAAVSRYRAKAAAPQHGVCSYQGSRSAVHHVPAPRTTSGGFHGISAASCPYIGFSLGRDSRRGPDGSSGRLRYSGCLHGHPATPNHSARASEPPGTRGSLSGYQALRLPLDVSYADLPEEVLQCSAACLLAAHRRLPRRAPAGVPHTPATRYSGRCDPRSSECQSSACPTLLTLRLVWEPSVRGFVCNIPLRQQLESSHMRPSGVSLPSARTRHAA